MKRVLILKKKPKIFFSMSKCIQKSNEKQLYLHPQLYKQHFSLIYSHDIWFWKKSKCFMYKCDLCKKKFSFPIYLSCSKRSHWQDLYSLTILSVKFPCRSLQTAIFPLPFSGLASTCIFHSVKMNFLCKLLPNDNLFTAALFPSIQKASFSWKMFIPWACIL